MEKVSVSVNLCTYNRKEMLRKTLHSLVQQETDGEFSFEIIVVDDASTDGTHEVVDEISRKTEITIRYIRGKGTGVADARNIAFSESHSEWIAMIDDDEVAEPYWLKELVVTALKEKAECVAGCMRLRLPENWDEKIAGTTRKMLGETIRPTLLKGKMTYMGPGSGNALVKREVFDIVGGFDPSMLYGGSDQDFFRRARRAGYKFAYSPNAIAYHVIPLNRLTPSCLFLTSRRWGSSLAYFESREKGIKVLIFACSARLLHAGGITVPRLIYAQITNQKAELVSRKCSLGFAEGYIRQTLFMLFPSIFSQKTFFGSINKNKFRDIRTKSFSSNQ